MKLTLEKSGSFNTHFIPGHDDQKCGMPLVDSFNYDVSIEGSDDHLTPEGFLIENGRIQEYFEQAYRKRQPVRSCEQIACDAAKQLASLVEAEGSKVSNVSVTIHGTPGAKITAVWTH